MSSPPVGADPYAAAAGVHCDQLRIEPYPSSSQATLVADARVLLMWMVMVSADGLVVNHSPREPRLALGVSSTKDELTTGYG